MRFRFLQSSQGRISISENKALREHGIAAVTCLLTGLQVFGNLFEERKRLLQLVRGVHGLHVYATEFWIEYLLIDASLMGGPDVSSPLFVLASELAERLNESTITTASKELIANTSDIDERLRLFQQHEVLYHQMKAALSARSRKRLELELLQRQGKIISNTYDL
jgi:hypothetical protein